ncbi:MAG: succinyl-diaminopimelate desuccinylase [Alphaproteobacteria bacterium]|nr:succinyl-diaminopimelate desuccinylase [Alphaproteobacteria bacterium]
MSSDTLKLAQKLIQVDSVTPDDGHGIAVMQEYLSDVGFECHELVFEDDEHGKVHNLYARIGEGSPNFCFGGHTDVVPPGNIAAWRAGPYSAEVIEGRLHGRGAEDMKGAIAAFAIAAKQFIESNNGVMPKGSISFLLTGDEEGPGVNGTPKMLNWLREQGEPLDVCLVGEPTNPEILGEMVKIGRRGSIITELVVLGKQGHVAYPALADNPVTKMVEVLHSLKNEVLDVGTEFFPPSNLEVTTVDVGNSSVNVIPEQAMARFNIRFNDLHHSDDLKKWIDLLCHKICGKDGYRLKFRVSGEAFLTPPGELSALVVNAIKRVTGIEPVLSTTGGTSDARVIKDYCPVIEFGTTGRTPHMVNEYVLVEDLNKLTEIYKNILLDYFK